MGGDAPLVGVHISARKKSQQWSAENFAALIRAIAARGARRASCSSGRRATLTTRGTRATTTRRARLLSAARGLPCWPVRPTALARLIAALSLCDFVGAVPTAERCISRRR